MRIFCDIVTTSCEYVQNFTAFRKSLRHMGISNYPHEFGDFYHTKKAVFGYTAFVRACKSLQDNGVSTIVILSISKKDNA